MAGEARRGAAQPRCVDRPVIDVELREREDLLSAAITVGTAEEIKQLFPSFKPPGYIPSGMMRQPWGSKNFIVKDPTKPVLFAGPAIAMGVSAGSRVVLGPVPSTSLSSGARHRHCG